MIDFIFTFILAAILGFLAGIGIGGGSLLILWLTAILGMPYPQARILNLLFFLPAALISCFFRKKQGDLPLKKILPAVITGAIAAAALSMVGWYLNTALLQKFFGGLLLATGVKELFYRPRKAK